MKLLIKYKYSYTIIIRKKIDSAALSKFENVPRGIQSEKSSKDMTRSQQLEHKHVTKRGTEPGVRKGMRFLLACHILANASWKPLIIR